MGGVTIFIYIYIYTYPYYYYLDHLWLRENPYSSLVGGP